MNKKLEKVIRYTYIYHGLFGIAGLLFFGTGLHKAFGQEAAEGLNDSFGGASDGLRLILDGIFGIEKFFMNFGCYFQGTFLGWDNVSCVIL